MEMSLNAFLTSTLDGGEWSDYDPGCFTSEEIRPRYLFAQKLRWAPQSVWTWWKEQNPCPYRESIPSHQYLS